MIRQPYDGRTALWFGCQRPTKSGESTRNESAGHTKDKGKQPSIHAMLNRYYVSVCVKYMEVKSEARFDN